MPKTPKSPQRSSTRCLKLPAPSTSWPPISAKAADCSTSAPATAAVEYARSRGAETIALTCNPNSQLERAAHFAIVTDVGPEVLTGSSRMKAGTAQKMVLNMITTGAMTRLGYVYGNLMVNLRLKNSKIAESGTTIIQQAARVSREAARKALQAGGSVAITLVMLKAGVSRDVAARALRLSRGNVREAITSVKRD